MHNSDFEPLFVNSAEDETNNSSFSTNAFNSKATNVPTREQRAEKDLLERVPPHNINAEKAIIGGIFLDPNAINSILDVVSPEDFYIPMHKALFQALIDLYKSNKPVDSHAVLIYLESIGQLENVGGAAYLGELSEALASEENAKYYASVVRDHAMQRALIRASAEIIAQSYKHGVVVDELLGESEKAIFEISERKNTKNFETIGDLTTKIFNIATKRTAQNSTITGVATHYTQLDAITAGLQPSDLIILAARPAMGKTAFALNLAMRVAVYSNKPVAIFSLEMSGISLAERMLSLWAKVALSNLKRGKLDDEDWNRLQKAAAELEHAPIAIDDSGELNTLALRAKCRRLKAQYKDLGLVVVDYLQLMRSSRTESRELEISDISRNLKALAKELEVPVLALSQLNRKVEERADKRPMLSDLRESGAIEQDADIIMFIHRDDYNKKDKSLPDTNVAEIIIGKHRNGATGTVSLTFLPEFTSFENMEYVPNSVD